MSNIMIIGGGGREHALAWRLAQEGGRVFVFPGNAGMQHTSSVKTLTGELNFETALKQAREHKISLVVIGPEKYLFEGWVDQFQQHSIPAFGPTQAASFLEASKIRAKLFMKEWKIPTAPFSVAQSMNEALTIIEAHPKWAGYVLKLSGPAQGKGVIVTHTQSEAKEAAHDFFKHRPSGIEDGMVIEEKISGREVSLFYVCLGEHYQFVASACDHKRLKDHDQGPNTGGMGAYSPAEWLSGEMLKKIEHDFVIPTLHGMKAQGTPFQGVLFLGIMMGPDGPSLLEYNTRFGDPETQTFLPLLKGNFSELLFSVATGEVHQFMANEITRDHRCSVHIVKAAKGYPGLFGDPIESGREIELHLSSFSPASTLFFAGVKEQNGKLLTSGGRVLGVTSTGATLSEARKCAYHDSSHARFENEHFRTDIGGTLP